MNKVIGITLVAASLMSVGCVPSSQSGSDYSRTEARRVQQVQIGTVLDKQSVTIEGTKSPAGTVAGGALGGVAGSAIGGGKGSEIAAVIGAIAGAAVGAATEEKLTKQEAFEYTIRLESGKIISVVQATVEKDLPIAIGSSVKLLSQGSTYRVTALPNPAVMSQ